MIRVTLDEAVHGFRRASVTNPGRWDADAIPIPDEDVVFANDWRGGQLPFFPRAATEGATVTFKVDEPMFEYWVAFAGPMRKVDGTPGSVTRRRTYRGEEGFAQIPASIRQHLRGPDAYLRDYAVWLALATGRPVTAGR